MVSPGGVKQQCLLIMTIYTAEPGLVLNTFARYAIISSKLSPALAAVNTAAHCLAELLFLQHGDILFYIQFYFKEC